jgi:hypothetical protein
MNIAFQKISDAKHILEIIRDHGVRESVECETRSYLVHDLLHYAVESQAHLATGFWGTLAKGKTLAELNDRTGTAMLAESADIAVIERMVGALSNAAKGYSAEDVMAGLNLFATASDAPLPAWLTIDFIRAVQERMRQLLGHWKATPYGERMELEWTLR